MNTHPFSSLASLLVLTSVLQADPLAEAEQHLQAREYKQAAVRLSTLEGDDHAAYLHATALFLDKQFPAAERAASAFLKAHADSRWATKARFLLARALIEQQKHKAAEAIYAAEAERVFSTARKQGLARRLIEFADKLSRDPEPGELDALPADHGKALGLYQQVLAMEITRDLRDDILFKTGLAQGKINQHAEGIKTFRRYLQRFDPTWSGAVGSPERKRGQLRENPEPAGRQRFEARLELIKLQMAAKQFDAARQNADDLLVLVAKERPDDKSFAAEVRLQRVFSFDSAGTVEQKVEARREFLAAHSDHEKAPGVSRWIAMVFRDNGRPDEAVTAFEEFLAGKNYKFVANDKATTPDPKTGVSPAAQLEEWKQQAAHELGQIRFQQQQYEKAIVFWEKYVVRYPNGAQWAASQSGIVNARFQLALEAIAADDEALARKRFAAFLTAYPLDGRARQILFTLGQMHMAAAEKLEDDDKPNNKEITKRYKQAVEEWSRLISKYPGTEESSLALYRTGIIHSEKLERLEEGLAAFKRLTWGSWANPAKARVTLLSEKSLGVATERTFRTNEAAEVAVTTRNIEKLKVSLYPLNLESYFRKTHQLARVDHLDIDLIKPEKTWEVEFDDYQKYREMSHQIKIPENGRKGFAGIVKVEGGDWSATTLVLRSDLDLILKSSRREVLVYAEDRLRGKPAAGAELLISDGSKIIGTGKTGQDGVFRARLEELKSGDSVRVFASTPRGVATNLLQIGALNFSSGLSARGYIHTDKPAYRPGEQVAIRGIIRDVKDGSYVVPATTSWEVRVTDPSGRLLAVNEVSLDKFGTFDGTLDLPTGAQLGAYTITAEQPDEGTTWTGTFQVADFKLDRIRLAFDFPQRVYFRGEKVAGTISATYYWGSPAAEQLVQYTTPDGRQLTGKTDAEGKLSFELDTAGYQPGQALNFSATIPTFNITQSDSVFLAQLGFGVTVKPAQPLALSGEPFEVEIKTTGADRKPVGKDLTLIVLRREAQKSNRTLEAVPWLSHAPPAAAEVTVEEHQLTTDPKTGKGALTLKLDKGGIYTLRVSGQDRFDQTVTGAAWVSISDDEDANKLRFFADKNTWDVGAKIPLRLHSRLDAGLALLTFEGEEILSHKVISLKKGYNPIEALVEHSHFPNFRVSVTLIDGDQLRAATKRFSVRRELKIAIKPAKETFAPGEKGEVEIVVTDQLGNPVEAAVSLALVNEALYALHPDATPGIVSFFQKGASRYTEFLLTSTAGFSYTAQSRRLIQKEAGTEFAYVIAPNSVEQYQNILNIEYANNPGNSTLFASCASNGLSVFNNDRARFVSPVQFTTIPDIQAGNNINVSNITTGGLRSGDAAITRNSIDAILNNPNRNAIDGLLNNQGGQLPNVIPQSDDGVEIIREFNYPTEYEPPELPNAVGFNAHLVAGPVGGGAARPSQPRQDIAHASVWVSPVLTDAKGKATVTLTFPETASQWRFTARGTTTATLVGESTEKVVTRKEFFADLRLPDEVQEGDTMPFLATLYNLTDYAGEVEFTLKVEGGGEMFQTTTTASVQKESTVEALFKPYTVPFASALKLTLTARAGTLRDSLERSVLVRPWGIEFASHSGGVTSDSAEATLELPAGQKYNGRRLTVTLSPSLEQAIIDLALARAAHLTPLDARRVSCLIWPEPQSPPSALLAAASALHYAREREASPDDIAALTRRTAEYTAMLVASQSKDGRWVVNRARETENYVSSATAYWGLVLADRAGIKVHPATLASAEKALLANLTKLRADDTEGKAILVHALALTGSADFSVANRLYRERDKLSETGLAYLAAAFVHMGRDGFARDLLGLLAGRVREIDAGGRKQNYWAGGTANVLVRDRAETTAMALWCYARLDRASGVASSAADFLVTEAARLRSTRSLGTVIAALAEYYQAGERNADDFEVALIVNGKTLRTEKSGQMRGTEQFLLMGDLLNAGLNRVRVEVRGRGRIRYAATLSGFSPDMKDPESMETPYFVSRHYYHDRLSYRDVPLTTLSTSPVTKLALGQRFRTQVQVKNKHHTSDYLVWEEHLPAGALLVEGTLSGNFTRHERRGQKMLCYFKPGTVGHLRYELVAHAPGKFRVLPSVLRDAVDRGRMRLGKAAELEFLAPDRPSPDPYQMNASERYVLATKLFEDGRFAEARKHLDVLYDVKPKDRIHEKELARMLLWIHTSREKLDAERLVEVFEVLRERYPQLVIPFDKILVVGRAYRQIGEFERAWLVFRAAIHSSFLNDSRISAVLEDQGQYLGSVKYQEDLWFEYPDSAEVTASLFALSQSLFQKAPEARAIAARERRMREHRDAAEADAADHLPPAEREEPEKIAMLKDSARLLHRFLTLYPTDPLADDAAFSEVNVAFALKDYPQVVSRAALGAERHPKSNFKSSFEYMAALGHFWQRHYGDALKSAVAVAKGDSKDRDYARYITAQIYHATGKPGEAMGWYEKVKSLYPDAERAIKYFEEKKIAVKEVTTVRPGEPVELSIDYRNVREAALQVYEVDLLKLYLREKNLADIARIDLAGIDPAAEVIVPLGDGTDFADKSRTVKLDLKEEGAFLVICRGDDLFTSGLVLVTPLKLEIQEDAAGSVRVNVRDTTAKEGYVPEVLVKVVGTNNEVFMSGHTDLRGIFEADGIVGTATVLARSGDRQFAFYRGTTTLGSPPVPDAAQQPQKQAAPATKGKMQLEQSDYLDNVNRSNELIQDKNWGDWDKLRRGNNKGVEVQQAK